ncbi:MAG: hypothetical protein ACFFG0_09635 [Candidatus Thorarchaeota archaeon]
MSTTQKLGKGMKEILHFLNNNPDEKFTKKDLQQKTGKTKGTINSQINTLIERNLINHTDPSKRPLKIWCKTNTSNLIPDTSDFKPKTNTSNLIPDTSDFKPESNTSNLIPNTSDFKPKTNTPNLILNTSKFYNSQSENFRQKIKQIIINDLLTFPSYDQVYSYILSSNDSICKTWKNQIIKYKKDATILALYSIIKKLWEDNLNKIQVINE